MDDAKLIPLLEMLPKETMKDVISLAEKLAPSPGEREQMEHKEPGVIDVEAKEEKVNEEVKKEEAAKQKKEKKQENNSTREKVAIKEEKTDARPEDAGTSLVFLHPRKRRSDEVHDFLTSGHGKQTKMTGSAKQEQANEAVGKPKGNALTGRSTVREFLLLGPSSTKLDLPDRKHLAFFL